MKYVCDELASLGVCTAYVPRKRRSAKRVLAYIVSGAGYLEVELHVLPAYAHHHGRYCFAWFGQFLQRQVEGIPMGSAFSVFVQRCWSVFRELYFSRTLDTATLRTPRSRVSMVLAYGVWIIILEVRYVDDL